MSGSANHGSPGPDRPEGSPAAVLLDADGTLVDSNYLHTVAWARAFAEHGVDVATSAKPEDLDSLRAVIDADDAIDEITSSQDVENAKPAPDLFLAAARTAQVEPDRAVALGDTVWDVRAANAAGIACICVTTGGISAQELQDAGAAAVYDDCRELLRWLDRSPIAALLQP